MKNLILFIAIMFVSFSTLFSQDIIELKSGEKLQVRITKIGMQEIEFRNYGTDADALVIKLDKFLVKSYEFEGQSAINVEQIKKLTQLNTADLYDKDIKMLFKIQPLHFIRNDFKLAVEKSIDYRSSYEVEFGLRKFDAGLFDIYGSDDGMIYFNSIVRYKMYLRPASVKMTDIGKNPMAGFYLAPYVTAGTSKNNDDYFDYSDNRLNNNRRTPNLYGGFGLDIGGQLTTSNIACDIFTGGGFSLNTANDEFSRNTSHISLGKIALRTGIRVGISDKMFKTAR